MKRHTWAALCCATVAGSAQADVLTPTSVLQFLNAAVDFGPYGEVADTFPAAEYGAFTDTVTVEHTLPDGTGFTAGSSLSTAISEEFITASGSATVTGFVTESIGRTSAGSSSLFFVSFVLAEDTLVSLKGFVTSVDPPPFTNAGAVVRIMRGQEIVFELSDTGAFNQSQVLPAGSYGLQASCATGLREDGPFGPTSQATGFDVQLKVIPAPAGAALFVAAGFAPASRRRR